MSRKLATLAAAASFPCRSANAVNPRTSENRKPRNAEPPVSAGSSLVTSTDSRGGSARPATLRVAPGLSGCRFGPAVVHDRAGLDREPRPELADARRLGGEDVAIDDGEVRELPDLEGADLILEAERAGGVDRVRPDRLLDRQLVVRACGRAVRGYAVHRGGDGVERPVALDERVRADDRAHAEVEPGSHRHRLVEALAELDLPDVPELTDGAGLRDGDDPQHRHPLALRVGGIGAVLHAGARVVA